MTPWRPLLSGVAGEKATAIAIAIADDIAAKLSPAALAVRAYHTTLLFAYVGRFTGEGRYTEVAEELFDEASQHLDRFGSHAIGLYGGLAGVVWLDAHLDRCFAEPGSAPENEEDGTDAADALAELLDRPAAGLPYDLIGGLAGLAIAWLERLPGPRSAGALARVVDRAAATALTTPDGLMWHTSPGWLAPARRVDLPDGTVDLGVAHGIAGLLLVLARIGAAGIARERCEQLVSGGAAWLLAQREPGAEPWLFPSQRTDPPSPALASVRWCYGGLGIGAALLASARLLGAAPLEDHARTILRSAAAVRDGRCVDAGLCHGFAGNAHIFNRAFQLTGDPALEQAARFWFGRVIELHTPGQGIGGYRAWGRAPDATVDTVHPRRPPRGAWVDDPGWLTGAAGTALALLAAVDEHAPAWDALLAISG